MRFLVHALAIVLCILPLAAQAPVARLEASPVYGPFVVRDERTAVLVGCTDQLSPAAFRAMMRDHPHVSLLVFADCSGTSDDVSNLEVGRLIRAAGLDAHVPPGASVRSGAIELLVAARRRQIDDGSEFLVHAWRDETGRVAGDYPASSPQHRKYLAYYREMGMSDQQAAAFYAMTNSAPHYSARRMTAAEMRGWLAFDADSPRIEYQALF